MLEKIFEKLNLGTNETRVYLALLEQGPSNAGRLAKKVSMPRSSLYGFLSNLAERGLVTQSEKENVKLWQAKAPDELLNVFDDRINELELAKDSLDKIVEDLTKKQVTDFTLPRFTYFEGVEGVRQILKDMLLYRDITTQAFWPINDMIDVLGQDFFEYLNIRRIKQNLYTQAIWPESKIVDIKKYPFLGVGEKFKREIRKAPKGIESSMGYWAYKNKVAFVSSRKESFGFIVESAEFRQMLKTQFEMLWRVSKPVSVESTYTEKFLTKL